MSPGSFSKSEWIDTLRVRTLAWRHRDPFDRLLVAHAFEEGCTLVSCDPVLEGHGVPMIRGGWRAPGSSYAVGRLMSK